MYILKTLNEKKKKKKCWLWNLIKNIKVKRSHVGNLPVYNEYRNMRNTKKTVVRHITGDFEVIFYYFNG